MQIKVQTPAKINLVLEILNKREDGFHEIQSIMQAVSLYDYLTIEVEDISVPLTGKELGGSNYITPDENKKINPTQNIIKLSGNSDLIPYDKANLVYKAAELFLQKTNLTGFKVKINIEKNIPVAAGLAGGSSNAAGTLWGLNKFFKDILNSSEVHELASQMGSDLNFCLEGGTHITTSRGEILYKITTPKLNILIIKPKNLFISAKEAYTKYDELSQKPEILGFEEIKSAIYENNHEKIAKLLNNNLEEAILRDYPEIREIKDYLIRKGCKNALMSGSGPSVFGIYEGDIDLSDVKPEWECFKVNTIDLGVTH